MSLLTNETIEYSVTYYKRIVVNYDPKTMLYGYIRFVGFIEKNLHIVAFPNEKFDIYWVRPDSDEEQGDISQIGKAYAQIKDPICKDFKEKLMKELSVESEEMQLIAKDFLAGKGLTYVSQEIVDRNFPKCMYK